MENRVTSLLGGRAATEIVYGEVDVGANNDLHRAFNIVARFVDDYCSYGFSYWLDNECSDYRQARREDAISEEMEKFYRKAKKILIDNREFLDKLAKELIAKKTLLQKDVAEIRQSCNN